MKLDKKSEHITDALISTWIDSRISRTTAVQYTSPQTYSDATSTILTTPNSSPNFSPQKLPVSNDENKKEEELNSPHRSSRSRSSSCDSSLSYLTTPGVSYSENESELISPSQTSTWKFSGSKLDYSAHRKCERYESIFTDIEDDEMNYEMEGDTREKEVKVKLEPSLMKDGLCSSPSKGLNIESDSEFIEEEWKGRLKLWIEQERLMEARKCELKSLPVDDYSLLSPFTSPSLTTLLVRFTSDIDMSLEVSRRNSESLLQVESVSNQITTIEPSKKISKEVSRISNNIPESIVNSHFLDISLMAAFDQTGASTSNLRCKFCGDKIFSEYKCSYLPQRVDTSTFVKGTSGCCRSISVASRIRIDGESDITIAKEKIGAQFER